MRHREWWLVIGLWLASGCQTTENAPSPDTGVAIAPQGPETDLGPGALYGPISPLECPAKAMVCTREEDPSLCSATLPESKEGTGSERLIVWARNGCLGINKLRLDACGRAVPPSRLIKVQCVPDASRGHCPTPKPVCRGVSRATRCRAEKYARQGLTPEQWPRGEGISDCMARFELKMDACRNNLDPHLLSKIVCEGQGAPQSQGTSTP